MRTLLVLVGALISVAAVGGCSGREAPAPGAAVPSGAPGTAARRVSSAEGTSPRGSAASSASASSASPVESPTPEPVELPDPPGSTRGTIACGGERCVAEKQTCSYETQKWHCVDGKPPPSTSMLYCDDGTDCGPGLTCCQTGASADRVLMCTKRHGPESDCAIEVCKPGGARCPRGSHCDGTYCTSELAVTCPGSGKKNCGNDEYCEWNAGTAACVKEPKRVEALEEPRGVFACTRPLDCGPGNQCCTSMSVSWHHTGCATNCDVANSQLVCETTADCKSKLELVPAAMRHQAKLGCKAMADEGPSWLKLCTLDLP